MIKKHFESPKKLIEMRSESLSLNELFPRFVAAKIAEGVSDKTVESYYNHWKCIGKHLDLDRTFEDLTQDDINNVFQIHSLTSKKPLFEIAFTSIKRSNFCD